jgi:hypothetical protein
VGGAQRLLVVLSLCGCGERCVAAVSVGLAEPGLGYVAAGWLPSRAPSGAFGVPTARILWSP